MSLFTSFLDFPSPFSVKAFGYVLNDTFLSELGDYSYQLVAANVTWIEARRRCTAAWAVLPMIRGYSEYTAMTEGL